MATSSALREVFAAGRPLVEQWLDVAEQIAALRDVATDKGLDWSQVKALLKAQIQDERDEKGDGKRVRRIVDKAEFASAYADMLGLVNMNEKKYSAGGGELDTTPHDPQTGELIEPPFEAQAEGEGSLPSADQSNSPVGISSPDPVKAEGGRHPSANNLPDPLSSPGLTAGGPNTSSDADGAKSGVLDSPVGQGGDKPATESIKSGQQDVSATQAGNEAGSESETAATSSKTSVGVADEVDVKDSEKIASAGAVKAAPADDFDPSKLSFLTKMRSIRPHCLRPELCGGYGAKHCYTCLAAAEKAVA